ncbi:SurA N-terminal domain-containing protein [Altererythrobacter sp. GH1-8]|uniref:SurA N-terminal domain-containing protein n=1 Tax=Altererythrobacter sp. GH1-8 TaxID=3349333 RepID=UPI00374CB6FD
MLTFFRNFFKTKIGLGITLAFLVLIGFAFASSDVAGTATFGGVAGGDRVAVVGDERIGTAELSEAAGRAVDQIRQRDPTVTMQAFIAQDGLDEVVDQLIDRAAIAKYAKMMGLRAGDNLVNSEIMSIPAFRGADGNFSQDAYEGVLAQQRLTDAEVREDLATGLLAQQLLTPIERGTIMPEALIRRYASLLRERRTGSLVLVPSAVFAPEGDPTDAQLKAFYDKNRERYIRPERRVLRYATFGADSVDDRIEPTPAEISARYERDAAVYGAKETRSIAQFIVPTEQAAIAIRDRVNAGTSFEAAAREAGFAIARSEAVSRSDLASSTSAAVAQAVFSAPRGQVANPARAPLGWYVVRVTDIQTTAARSLAQATPDIREQLRTEKRAAAISDLSAEIDDRLGQGESLSQVAQGLGLELRSSPPLTADGQVYGAESQQPLSPVLRPAIDTAFQMEEEQPQLAEVVRGQAYLIFEVTDITPSAAAPLSEIKEQVTISWRLSEGMAKAREAADRILERLRTGKADTLQAAISAEAERLPAAEQVNLGREQIMAQQGRVPPALALMFSMAEGTSKKLEAGNDLGWFVVDLKDISTDPIADDDPILAATRAQLQGAMSDEHTRQLVRAIRDELGVERNDTAIEAVRRQLSGES